jgi:hypothetical protein
MYVCWLRSVGTKRFLRCKDDCTELCSITVKRLSNADLDNIGTEPNVMYVLSKCFIWIITISKSLFDAVMSQFFPRNMTHSWSYNFTEITITLLLILLKFLKCHSMDIFYLHNIHFLHFVMYTLSTHLCRGHHRFYCWDSGTVLLI